MNKLQYTIHLILHSKYRNFIILLINLTLYLLLYQQNTAYCIGNNPETEIPIGQLPAYPPAPEGINVDALYAEYNYNTRRLQDCRNLLSRCEPCCEELNYANSEIKALTSQLNRATTENLEIVALKDQIKALEEAAKTNVEEITKNRAIISNIPFMAVGFALFGALTPQILSVFIALDIPSLW